MPIYGYTCDKCEHTFDALQKMSDPKLVDCPECGKASLRRLLSAPKFRLKGAGWYETDFKTGDKRNLVGDSKSGNAAGREEGKHQSDETKSKRRIQAEEHRDEDSVSKQRSEVDVKRIRRYLVAGLLVWIPLGATLMLVKFAVGQMDKSIGLLPHNYQPGVMLQQWFGTENPVEIPGFGVILIIIVLLGTGVLAANFVGRAFMGRWESLLDRIPFVRAIYSGAKNFAEIVFSDSSESFKKVLLIEYPRNGLYSLAFQTANRLGEIDGRTGDQVICCFVPTTPNPTSGFIIILPKEGRY